MNREYETNCDREKLVHSLCGYTKSILSRIEASLSPSEFQVTMEGVVIIRRDTLVRYEVLSNFSVGSCGLTSWHTHPRA